MQRRGHIAPPQQGRDVLLDILRRTLFNDQHRLLATGKVGDLLGHQWVGYIQNQQRQLGDTKGIGQTKLLQRAHQRTGETTLDDDADVSLRPLMQLVQAMPDDIVSRCRQTLLQFEFFMTKGRGRMRQPRVIKMGRFLQWRE